MSNKLDCSPRPAYFPIKKELSLYAACLRQDLGLLDDTLIHPVVVDVRKFGAKFDDKVTQKVLKAVRELGSAIDDEILQKLLNAGVSLFDAIKKAGSTFDDEVLQKILEGARTFDDNVIHKVVLEVRRAQARNPSPASADSYGP